jgi:hypothetical protein
LIGAITTAEPLDMPMRGELPIPVATTYRRPAGPSAAEAGYSLLAGIIRDPDLEVILEICAIGLLLTVLFIHAFPNFGEMAVQLEIFG